MFSIFYSDLIITISHFLPFDAVLRLSSISKKFREIFRDITPNMSLRLNKIMNMSVYDRWYISLTEGYVGMEHMQNIQNSNNRWVIEKNNYFDEIIFTIVPRTTCYISTNDCFNNIFITIAYNYLDISECFTLMRVCKVISQSIDVKTIYECNKGLLHNIRNKSSRCCRMILSFMNNGYWIPVSTLMHNKFDTYQKYLWNKNSIKNYHSQYLKDCKIYSQNKNFIKESEKNFYGRGRYCIEDYQKCLIKLCKSNQFDLLQLLVILCLEWKILISWNHVVFMFYKYNIPLETLITKSIKINIVEKQYDLLYTFCSDDKLKNIEILEEYLMKKHNVNIGSSNPEAMNHLFNLCCVKGNIEIARWIINCSILNNYHIDIHLNDDENFIINCENFGNYDAIIDMFNICEKINDIISPTTFLRCFHATKNEAIAQFLINKSNEMYGPCIDVDSILNKISECDMNLNFSCYENWKYS